MKGFNMTNKYKIDRLVDSLENGEHLSSKQIRSRFGFSSLRSVHATLSKLRLRDGFPVLKTPSRKGYKYFLAEQTPQEVVAAGFRALSGDRNVLTR